jgi:hypothetical protein
MCHALQATFDLEHWEYGTTGGDPITLVVVPYYETIGC